VVSFVIRDDEVALAFRYLKDNAIPAAAARADRERREDLMKAARARAYLGATGTVAEREAQSILSDDYVAQAEGFYRAVQTDEEYRLLRSQAEQLIEAWRTTQANQRANRKDWERTE
jgi:hypothetical protein